MADYTGDGDIDVPFEAARQNADRLGINYELLPRLPFWSRLAGQTREDYHTKVAAKIMSSSASIGRELSQGEKDALAYHFGKVYVTLSYGTPLAAVMTVGFLQRTNKTYGFPFYTPKPPNFNPDKFPGLPGGSTSRFVWHLTRGLTWYAASKVVAGVLISSYGISVYAARLRADPRLEAYRQDITRRASQSASGIQRPGMVPGFPEHRQQQLPSYGGNPASPSTPSPPSWAIPDRSAQESTSAWPGVQSSRPKPPEVASDVESSVFDDVSPVAPLEQQEAASEQPTQQGGSAWERLRNQAQASRSHTTAWAKKRDDEMTSRGAQQGTSYSYSSADQENAYSKEQAQKEFDDMLEEERRGQTSGRR